MTQYARKATKDNQAGKKNVVEKGPSTPDRQACSPHGRTARPSERNGMEKLVAGRSL